MKDGDGSGGLLRPNNKMRQLYTHQHEGIRFSKNGHAAYQRGEKPVMLWTAGDELEQTQLHHIETGVPPFCKRPLVMFYCRIGVAMPANE